MDEIFGEENFVTTFIWVKKYKGSHLSNVVRDITEYIISYAKDMQHIGSLWGEKAYSEKWQPLVKRINNEKILKFPKNYVLVNLGDGIYKSGIFGEGDTKVELLDDVEVKNGIIMNEFRLRSRFIWIQSTLDEEINKGTKIKLSKNFKPDVLRYNQ